MLLLPPQHVKGYLRGQKNDYNDARAILEAAQHGHIKPVPCKSIEQQDQQALIRVRKLLVSERTRLVNQIRGLLYEYGITVRPGVSSLRKHMPLVLDGSFPGLSEKGRREIFAPLYQRLLSLDEELKGYDQKLLAEVAQDEACKRLIAIPGFGPVVSYAFKSWIGTGKQFERGRDASAAVGLVPRQYSSGDKQVLSGISKRGDRYLRSLLVHGARAVVNQAQRRTDPLSCWINRLVETRGKNKATVALANKLVRIAWVIVARNERYQAAS